MYLVYSCEARHVNLPNLRKPRNVPTSRKHVSSISLSISSHNMHRCNCSTRALECFVKDFSGIAIRQQRAQRFFQHYRSLSTRPPLRQLQTANSASTDDAFIPFDFEAAKWKREDVRRAEKSEDAAQKEREALTSERYDGLDGGEEEWHAEVEITSSDAQAHKGQDRRMDEVRSEALLAKEGLNTGPATPTVPILNLPAISQHIPATTVTPEDTPTDPHAESKKLSPRQIRKLVRIEQGRYKPNSMSNQGKESEDCSTVDEVLGVIEAMQGPSVLKNEKRKASDKDDDSARTAKGKAMQEEDAAKMRKSKDKSKTTATTTDKSTPAPKKERWQIDKAALKQKFGGEGWNPRKRLSPDTLEGIRALHSSDPATYSTQTLAEHFQVTPDAIRRILKSKWQPSAEDSAKRMERWEKRGLKKWAEMAEQGMRPPKKWRAMGVGKDGEDDGGQERKISNGRKGKEVSSWDDAVEAAGRLPKEASFADRIL